MTGIAETGAGCEITKMTKPLGFLKAIETNRQCREFRGELT